MWSIVNYIILITYPFVSEFSENEMDTLGEVRQSTFENSHWDQLQQYSQPSSWVQIPNQYTLLTTE